MKLTDIAAGGTVGETSGIIAEFPCTETQSRCWFLDQLKPGNPALNVAVRWEIRGAFKTSSIEAAFRHVIERHEIFRTRLVETDGRPCQQVVEKVDFRMSVIDLRNVPSGQREERIQSIAREAARVPFDLGTPGLLRVTFLTVENDRGFVLITAHQSCFDGWSIRVLGREIGETAAAIDAGRKPDLPELPLQYGDYALWQQEYLESYGFETEKAFWREQLAGTPYFEVAPDRSRGKVKTSRGEIIGESKPRSFSDRIDAAARERQVSQFAFGAAVITAMLHRFTGEHRILLGTQIAGREQVELENMIGVFINNLVLNFDVSGGTTFADHARATSEIVNAALNHQRMPFNRLVELINPPRDPSRNPLVSVNFNLQKAFLENAHYGGFELISSPSQSPGVIYDLNFIMVGRPTGWRMSVEYNQDLFDAETAHELLRLWQECYETALADPSARLDAFPAPASPRVKVPSTAGGAPDVEQLLRAHPDVAEAALAAAGMQGSSYAFVVPSSISTEPLETLPARLMDHLAGKVPADRMPSGVSVMMALPKTPSGTIDRAALKAPKPVPAEPPATKKHAPARQDELARLWAETLGIDEVRSGDDFFALGGHSLLALRMLSAVREKFGIKPDLATLFRHPVLSTFASEVFGEEPVEIDRSDQSAPPAAAIAQHANWEASIYRRGEGALTVYTLNHPFLYYRLASELPEDVTVVNLHMFNAAIDDELRKRSLEEIAAEAIGVMDLDKAAGPIALVGLCVNGVLAVEMTRQLRRRGVEIAFLAIIDTWAPGYYRAQSRLLRWRWFLEVRIKRLIHLTGRLLSGRIKARDYLKEFRITEALLARLGRLEPPTHEEEANAAVTELLVQAARRYRPKSIDDENVVLFRSQATHKRAHKLLFGWRGLMAERTPVCDIRGWHENALTSAGIRGLAEIMTEHLSTAADRMD